jgi:polar amino acid transport system permease protein
VALSVNLGAYSIEIVRAGLEAIPRSQIEAGQSLGLSPVQIFRYVVIFPALRLMYPALASQFVLLMLATSVVSQISATDLFHMASIIQSRTFRDFEVYVLVAAAYLALALVFRILFAALYQIVFARR